MVEISEIKPKKNNYIFPEFLAKAMKKIDLRTQYEASMMSMVLILIGIVVSGIYFTIYVDLATWYKVFLCINALAGVGFLGSFLVMTFQQYKAYLEVKEFQRELKGGKDNA